MKNLKQVKDRIKNMAREKDINPQIFLRNYMLERLLERISLSDFNDKFILKGGMLVAALVGVDMRSTIDMDGTIKSYPVALNTIQSALDSILSVEIDGGVEMRLMKLESLIVRGVANTRMRDFYDLYILSKVQGDTIDHTVLAQALIATSENRGSNDLLLDGELIIKEVFESDVMRGHWKATDQAPYLNL